MFVILRGSEQSTPAWPACLCWPLSSLLIVPTPPRPLTQHSPADKVYYQVIMFSTHQLMYAKLFIFGTYVLVPMPLVQWSFWVSYSLYSHTVSHYNSPVLTACAVSRVFALGTAWRSVVSAVLNIHILYTTNTTCFSGSIAASTFSHFKEDTVVGFDDNQHPNIRCLC